GYGTDSLGVPMGDERSAAAGGFPSMPNYEPSAGAAPLAPSRPGPWIRLLSLIIDGIVVNVASAPAFLMLSSPQEVVDWLLNVSDGIDAEMPAGIGIASLLSFVLWFVYRAAMESSGMKGSLGKLATGQRVVNFEGGQLSFGQSLKRNSFYLIQGLLSILPFLGFIYMIVYAVGISRDPYNQSHTDKWSKAYVVTALYAPLPSDLPAAAAARRGFLLPASARSPSSPWMATPLEVAPGRAGGSIGAMLNVLTGFGVSSSSSGSATSLAASNSWAPRRSIR